MAGCVCSAGRKRRVGEKAKQKHMTEEQAVYEVSPNKEIKDIDGSQLMYPFKYTVETRRYMMT